MQLEKIKLSGFKSFVDQTVIPISGNLTAIVGPNGCGKSNIIDAIRWVMGESSAKHLRGGSMADVIFNGSSGRKPVSMATVELVFDNTKNKMGGAYAQYDSISIKRQVSRDGQSLYQLNGARCRRKDVTDLFLGTGLGARSYAIIEQGTISRMVESKPEELRVHIEEAAGISKYKERREETEQRMRNTRENLERLIDVRDEVEKQLNHLQKQAAKAEQYTQLKQQERRFKLELLAMRWQSYQATAQALHTKLHAVAADHNRLFVEVRELDAQITTERSEHKQLQHQLEQSQGAFYQVSAEAGQLEQAIRHNEKDHEQTLIEIKRLQQQVDEARSALEDDEYALQDIQENIITVADALTTAQASEKQCLEHLHNLQLQQAEWQSQWEQFRSETAKHSGQVEVQRVKMTQFEQQTRQLHSRLERLRTEHAELSSSSLPEEQEVLSERIEILTEQLAEQHEELQSLSESLQSNSSELKLLLSEQQARQAEWHALSGQISSLELLQQHAMGKDNQKLQAWLQTLGLDQQQRLAEFVEVEAGWEVALETVLGLFLEAVCTENAEAAVANLDALSGQSLTVFETQPLIGTAASSQQALTPLAEKVKAPWPLHNLLHGIYCAEDLSSAQQQRSNLAAHESIITPDGVWLGANWVQVIRAQDAKQGVLQREQQLRQLKLQAQSLQETLEDITARSKQLEAELHAQQQQRDQLQQHEKQSTKELATQQSHLNVCNAQLQQQERRLEQLDAEIEDALAQSTEYAEEMANAETLHGDASSALAALNAEQQRLEALQHSLKQQLHTAESALNNARQEVHKQQAQGDSLRAAENLTIKQIERLKLTQQQAAERSADLDKKLQDLLSPLDDERLALEEARTQKQQLEHVLREHRSTLQASEQKVNQLAEELLRAQQNLEAHKQQLDKIRFEQQECDVRQQTVTEQLQELEADPQQVLQDLDAQAEEAVWKVKLEKLTTQITNLGSINLTAIEEYKAQSERMKFLTEQHDDLTHALETLQQAISKIDKESRQRFKETFDKINTGLQQKFPKLFGGGQAYLQLTQDDLLEAGVNIIAQPPGKRNSSIHLLSGGEKALTAVALVFAIFELNPAPFCLLDEVDAPLDDANVGRFSQMVAEMSETVQFLYISHNKATMEIAKQLAGVTMKEPGVSRMVAVDIEEAVSLAEK